MLGYLVEIAALHGTLPEHIARKALLSGSIMSEGANVD